MKFQLTIAVHEDTTPEERRETVARLLVITAERLRRGHDFGGFRLGLAESHDGAFAFLDK